MTLPSFHVRVDKDPANVLPPYSDKAILPANILKQIISIFPNDELPHPLIFRVHQDDNYTDTGVYISVKEFSSPEDDLIILPNHIRQKLQLDIVRLELVKALPKPNSINLQPKQKNYNIINWKYFLEYTLTKFYTTLTTGQTLVIEDDNLRYELDIVEIDGSKETKTVCIIDADILLDIPTNEITSTVQSVEIVSPQEFSIDISSFKKSFTPTVYKVDLTKFTSLDIKLIADNINECDLIVGFDKFLNIENFKYSTMNDWQQKQIDNGIKSILVHSNDEIVNKINDFNDNDEYDKWLYIVAFSWEEDMKGKLVISTPIAHPNDEDIEIDVPSQGDIKCSNCLKYIAPAKYQLHEVFCLRNNVKCSQCDSVFLHEIPSSHWHCPQCDFTTNLATARFKHDKLFHQSNYLCICGTNFDNHFDLASHKSSTCPRKLHTCRFCHMILPQGQSTYIDKFENLTNHENDCGNKTTECYKCSKIFRLKDIKKHVALHNLDKQQFNLRLEGNFQKCHNENCINELTTTRNDLDLCELCYGPLYIQVHDPTHIKLQQRIERKYMLQLTKGCGNEWCNNEYCVTNSTELKEMTFKQKLTLLNQTLFTNINFPHLPINKTKQTSSINKFWFCINESILMKKMIYEIILSENEYSSEIILKAINNSQNEKDARLWLNENGMKVKS